MGGTVSRQYFVYMLTNSNNSVLYAGITNNLARRLAEHRKKRGHGFSAKYNTTKLILYEIYNDSFTAISREKQIKNYSRKRKEGLVNQNNPGWDDLADELEI